jgi:hypothetical protein
VAPNPRGPSFKAQASSGSPRRSSSPNVFEHHPRTIFQWEGVNAGLVLDGIISCLNNGDAVTLSLTSDGGAVKLTLWRDGQKHVGYAAGDDDLHELCELMKPPEPQNEVPAGFKGSEGRGK